MAASSAARRSWPSTEHCIRKRPVRRLWMLAWKVMMAGGWWLVVKGDEGQ